MIVTELKRVALVNDYELVLRGLAALLDPFRDRIRVVELDIGHSVPHAPVDIALFDTYGHPHNGLDRVRELADDRPRVGAVVVYTWAITNEQCEAVVAAGARGVIAKSEPAEALVHALLAIDEGEMVVSPAFGARTATPGPATTSASRRGERGGGIPREGLSNREMADALSISEHTVKSHLKAIFQKTGVASRAQAVARIAGDPGFRRIRNTG